MPDLARLAGPDHKMNPMTSVSFVLGANLPWVRYGCDFGTNAWQTAGIARDDNRRTLADAAHMLKSSGIRTIRWFLLCDARSGIRFDSNGIPLGLDHVFFDDLDAALRPQQSPDSRTGVRLVIHNEHACRHATPPV